MRNKHNTIAKSKISFSPSNIALGARDFHRIHFFEKEKMSCA